MEFNYAPQSSCRTEHIKIFLLKIWVICLLHRQINIQMPPEVRLADYS